MNRHDKKKYYNELREKYMSFADDDKIRNDFCTITRIKTPGWEMFSKEELVMLYNASDMTKLKNGFLRSFDRVYNNPNFSLETKKRIFKNMVNSYKEIWVNIREQIELIKIKKTKDDHQYMMWEKLEDVKKIKVR